MYHLESSGPLTTSGCIALLRAICQRKCSVFAYGKGCECYTDPDFMPEIARMILPLVSRHVAA